MYLYTTLVSISVGCPSLVPFLWDNKKCIACTRTTLGAGKTADGKGNAWSSTTREAYGQQMWLFGFNESKTSTHNHSCAHNYACAMSDKRLFVAKGAADGGKRQWPIRIGWWLKKILYTNFSKLEPYLKVFSKLKRTFLRNSPRKEPNFYLVLFVDLKIIFYSHDHHQQEL